MTRLANEFVDPNTATRYVWPVNHSEEGDVNLIRSIAHGANTANTGLVRQQGDDSPLIFAFTGTIFSQAQLQAFIGWYNLGRTQTIYFQKYDGDLFEVFITEFNPQQKRVVRNPKDAANAPLWIWTYSMRMEVVTVLSGNYAGIA